MDEYPVQWFGAFDVNDFIDSSTFLPPATLAPPALAPEKKARAYGTSCAACRLRKVKCVTSNPSSASCDTCKKKDIRCVGVDAPATGKRKQKVKGRSGGRIEFARQAFGEASSESPTPPESSSAGESSLWLSPTSVATQLDQTQISACFCSALVDSYYACSYFLWPCLDWKELRYRYAAVGYRLSELSNESQALMAVIVATSARVAVYEGIIGPSPLNNMDVLPLQDGLDLASLGDKRDAICKTLVKQAQLKLGETEMLLTPSPETIASLYLLFTLMNGSGGTSGRQYMALACSHLRQLHENDQNTHTKVFSDFVNIMLSVRDAMTAASVGASLQLSEDDRTLFWQDASQKELLLEHDLIYQPIANPSDFCWSNLVHPTSLVQLFAFDTEMRKSAFDPQAVHAFWAGWDALWELISFGRARLGPAEATGYAAAAAAGYYEMCRCCMLDTLMACHKGLDRRLNTTFQSHPEREVLIEMKALSHTRLLQGSVDLAGHLEMLLTKANNITLVASVQALQGQFDDWLQLVQAAPTASEGGPLEFDEHAKIQALNAYVVACNALSYSWPGFKAKADQVSLYQAELVIKMLNQQAFQ